ncbi:hypothetical protein ACFYW8_10700 [Streptomyces sp. NPDC002742]|uniref:hypothetical protein n=1 Tax=Streptomyces sp. NPDC002742 TaxID=3364663 RepID=UPI0036962DCF
MDTPSCTQPVLLRDANGDFSQVAPARSDIAAATDGREMYGVCCALAEAARQALIRLYGHPSPQLLWALAAPDPAEGPQHPARNFSLRFITAYVNGDLLTCQALHQAAASAGSQGYEHFLKALIAGVSDLTRVALEERTANSETPAQHPY